MDGATRIIPSQPLYSLAPKTASGGKIRAHRVAPERMPRNWLYQLRKTQLRGQTRVGVLILANTIGNAVAGSISSQDDSTQQVAADNGGTSSENTFNGSIYNGASAAQIDSAAPNPLTGYMNIGSSQYYVENSDDGSINSFNGPISNFKTLNPIYSIVGIGGLGGGDMQYNSTAPRFNFYGRQTPLNNSGQAIDQGVVPLWNPLALSVKGNVLTGTVVVMFSSGSDGDATLSPQLQASVLSKINGFNQYGSDGYGININFRSPNSIESLTGLSVDPVMNVDVKSVGYYQNNNMGSILGLESDAAGSIEFEVDADQHTIDHEVAHFFGIGHSFNQYSLMYPYEGNFNTSITKFNQQEIVQIIKAYKK